MLLLGVFVACLVPAAAVYLRMQRGGAGALGWLATPAAVSSSGSVSATARTARAANNGSATDALPELEGTLTTMNESGRSGAFYFPPRSATTALPVLVALHGQGGEGRDMVGAFRALALARRFAIIAPSSNFVPEANSMTWRGSRRGRATGRVQPATCMVTSRRCRTWDST